MAAHRHQARERSLTFATYPLARTLVLLGILTIAACTPGDGAQDADTTGAGTATVGTDTDSRPAAPGLEPSASGLEPSAAERDAILAPLQTLFDALEAGDAELLRSVVAPGTVMSFTETRDGTTTVGTATLDQLAERITSSPVPLIERMWDPVVMVDGPLATIWTPYDFYAGPDLSHCGIDAATLLLGEGAWRIVGLSWTRDQPPMCALHPDGPPER